MDAYYMAEYGIYNAFASFIAFNLLFKNSSFNITLWIG
jgi:hypothetical protein